MALNVPPVMLGAVLWLLIYSESSTWFRLALPSYQEVLESKPAPTLKILHEESSVDPKALLHELAEKYSPPKQRSVRVNYVFEWDLKFPNGGKRDLPPGPYQKYVEFELYSNGSLIENSWIKLDALEPDHARPSIEIQFDGKSMLYLARSEDENNLAPQLIYFPRPTLAESRGNRGDGFLGALGMTATYNNQLWSVWDIAKSGRVTIVDPDRPTVVLVSKGDFGQIEIEMVRQSGALSSISISSTRPEHWWHGTTLDGARKSRVTQRFFDFSFVPVSDTNLLGVESWSAVQEHAAANGRKHIVTGNVRIISYIGIAADTAPDLTEPLRFRNAIPNGTQVTVVDVPIEYEFRDARLHIPDNSAIQDRLSRTVLEPVIDSQVDTLRLAAMICVGVLVISIHAYFALKASSK